MTNDAPSTPWIPIARMPRASWWSLTGLLLGILGLIIQAIAEPAKFTVASLGIPFPPGILFILGAGILMIVTCRWRWHPLFAILIGVWIVGVGAKFLLPNLTSPVAGTVAGNIVMAAGLIASVIAGVLAIAAPRRPQPSTTTTARRREPI